jgi:hypothetical protein
MKGQTYTYSYNSLDAIVEDGNYLWVAFDTDPTIIAKVSKASPSVLISAKVLDTGYNTVLSLGIDGDNLWAVCNLNPGKIQVINKTTLETVTTISPTEEANPKYIIFTGDYAVISKNNTKVIFYNKNTFVYQFTVDLTSISTNNIVGLDVDSAGNVWGCIGSEAEGKFFRIDPNTQIATGFTIVGITDFGDINIDSEDFIWIIANLPTPGKILKINIESGDIVNYEYYDIYSSDLYLLNIKIIEKSLNKYIYLFCYDINNEIVISIKGYIGGESGEEFVVLGSYDFDNINELEDITKPLIVDDDYGFAGGIETSPATLFVFDTPTCKIFSTYFPTILQIKDQYKTKLNCIKLTFKKFATNLITILSVKDVYKTDLRCRLAGEIITPKSLDDFIVYKDGDKDTGTELPDVNYSSLKINFNLNSTPSEATFVLARRHDNINKTLADVSSIITNENKITIYDGDRKLFTGYITQINADGGTDTVSIRVQDVRYKIAKVSVSLSYGVTVDPEEGVTSYGSTYNAVSTVIGAISGLINGCDGMGFGFVPEYTEETGDCGTLLDNLIANSANINWYTDENERLRFQRVAQGTKKELPLSGLNIQRNIYDIIVNSITINKHTNNYCPRLIVKLGKHTKDIWGTGTFSFNYNVREINELKEIDYDFTKARNESIRAINEYHIDQLPSGQLFVMQETPSSGGGFGAIQYVGSSIRFEKEFVDTFLFPKIKGYVAYHYLINGGEYNLSSATIGAIGGGNPTKTISLTGYGKKSSSYRFVEGTNMLFLQREEEYDFTGYALDLAYFQLSQNNKLLTEATVELLLDAYEYYNINFSDLINIGNTIDTTIYKNNNGFPLNISGISIDCATRKVTLNLTNYGKTWAVRGGNYGGNYRPIYKIGYAFRYEDIDPLEG